MIDQSDDEGKQIIFVNDLTNVVFAEYKRQCPEGFILHCLVITRDFDQRGQMTYGQFLGVTQDHGLDTWTMVNIF